MPFWTTPKMNLNIGGTQMEKFKIEQMKEQADKAVQELDILLTTAEKNLAELPDDQKREEKFREALESLDNVANLINKIGDYAEKAEGFSVITGEYGQKFYNFALKYREIIDIASKKYKTKTV